MTTTPNKVAAIFDNPCPGRDYTIHINALEFTCLCPKTGQSDFATLLIEYVPDKLCVELKSLKLYFLSFRDKCLLHETVTNQILFDLVNATEPNFMRLTAKFNVRGGNWETVVAEHRKEGWIAPQLVTLP